MFTIVGDFIEPVPTIIIFMPLVNALTQAGDINGVHMGVVLIATLAFGLITPPYGLVLLMASKFVGVSFAKALRAALPIYVVFLVTIMFHDLFSKSGAVAAEAGDPGIGRLLQGPRRKRVYLPELIVVPAKAGPHRVVPLIETSWSTPFRGNKVLWLWVPAFAGTAIGDAATTWIISACW